MSLYLVNIYLDEDKPIADLRRLSEEISLDIDADNLKMVNKTAILALQAFQSAVPIHGFQLRNDHIQYSAANKKQSTFSASVYIIDRSHNSSPKPTGPSRSYLSSPRLAEILDQGYDYLPRKGSKIKQILHRSQNSQPTGPYSFSIGQGSRTKRWINRAYDEFIAVLDKNLDKGI